MYVQVHVVQLARTWSSSLSHCQFPLPTPHTWYTLPLSPHGLHGGYWLAWVSKLSQCLACVTGTPLIIKSTNDKKERPCTEEKWSGELSWISWAIVLRQSNIAMIKTFCGQSTQKKVWILEWRSTNFTVVREVLCNNYQSHNFISQRNSTLFTKPFLARKCGWAGQLN